MLIVYILDENGNPSGFMQKSDHIKFCEKYDDWEVYNKIAFEIELNDDTPNIYDSFFNKCKLINDTWRDNFEEIGCDVEFLMKAVNKVQVFS